MIECGDDLKNKIQTDMTIYCYRNRDPKEITAKDEIIIIELTFISSNFSQH